MSILFALLRRIVFWSVAIIAVLLLLWGGLCLEERWRWKRAWSAYRSAALARGVKLEIQDFQQPPIADEENFAAIPMIRDLFVDPQNGVTKPKWFAELKISNYRRPATAPSVQRRMTDLVSWRDHFVAEHVITEPSENAAADVLRALQVVEPELEQLRSAGRRPKARFPLHSELGVEAPQPHLTALLGASWVYPLAMAAHLELKDSASAYRNAREMLRLYESLKEEPTLITALIRVAIVTMFDAAIRDGLASNLWAEPELLALVDDYAHFDWLPECQHTLATERAFMNKTCDLLEKRSSAETAQKYSALGLWGSWSSDPTLLRAAIVTYPRGWLYLSQLKSNEYYDRQIARIDSLEAGGPPNLTDDELKTISSKGLLSKLPYWTALSSISTVEGTIERYLQIMAQTRITQIALQLARYHRKSGAFPNSLEELVPNYVRELPKDPMDLQPLRYHQRTSGYDLWSIGLDRRDDGGKSLPGKGWRDQPDWVFSINP